MMTQNEHSYVHFSKLSSLFNGSAHYEQLLFTTCTIGKVKFELWFVSFSVAGLHLLDEKRKPRLKKIEHELLTVNVCQQT
jgi:hypothetical protein